MDFDQIPLPRPAIDEGSDDTTAFKSRWNDFARANRLSDDPTAPVPKANVAELRRAAAEFFSWGLVHQTETRRRLDELLPPGQDRSRRRSCRRRQ